MKTVVWSLAALLALVTPALADETKSLGNFRAWDAFSLTEGAAKVCFMATKPTRTEPAGARRGDIYVMVTHRPADKSLGVVSVVAGYTYKKDSEVKVTIDKQTFTLFTDGDSAWARDDAGDKALVAALRSGSSLKVVGVSARGTTTTDTYSLAGSSAAYTAISTACGVK